MELNHLSKSQLNELLRRVTGRGRDLARNSKGDLILALDSLPEAAVSGALDSLGLIAGVWSGAASSAPLAEPAPAVEQLPDIHVVAQKSLGEIFGIRGKFASITVDVWNDPAAPALDSLYKFDPEQLSSAVSAIKRGRNVWLATRRLTMNNTGNLVSDITATFAALAIAAYGVIFLANAANLI